MSRSATWWLPGAVSVVALSVPVAAGGVGQIAELVDSLSGEPGRVDDWRWLAVVGLVLSGGTAVVLMILVTAAWTMGATGGRVSAWVCAWSATAVALFLAFLLG